ncbi:Mog1p/PsbP-like protein [Xylariaceae sp. FL0016]|nr:Mog1p/PsbP-like protein [Xylariaceae sp. FL0016]
MARVDESKYVTRRLFGGAIVCDVPSNFADVSTLRQVPDNQEVWLDKDGFTSMIFEINERVGGPGSSPEIDGKALTTHLEEIVGDDFERCKVWNTMPTTFSKLEDNIPRGRQADLPAYTLIATVPPRSKPSASGSASNPSSPDFTAIILTLLRLEDDLTDILVTLNVPHIKGEYDEEDVSLEMGRSGKLIGDAVNHMDEVWKTMKIQDWGLFKEV